MTAGGFVFTPGALGELEASIARSPEFTSSLMEMGEAVLEYAKSEAEPIGHRHDDSPDGGAPYKDSFDVMLRPVGSLMAAVIYNTSYDAVWVESGTHPGGGSTPALGFHILANALNAVMGAALAVDTLKKPAPKKKVSKRKAAPVKKATPARRG